MKRLYAFFLSMVMVISMAAPAYAEEETAPTEFYVKYMATNIRYLWSVMALEANPAASNVSQCPKTFTEDATMTVDGVDYIVHCVKPTYTCADLRTTADSYENSNSSALDKYIKDNLFFTQTNPAYETARGVVEDFIRYPSVRNSYVSQGTTYNLEVTINDYVAPLKVIVTGTDNSEPYVDISAGRKVSCTPNNVEYSLNRRDWKSVRDGGVLPQDCAGYTVYFRTPASAYASASDWVSVYCKEDQSAPSERLTLEANSYSVWITNASKFSGCEFSINNSTWTTKTAFEGLQPSTAYTVYVRAQGDRYTFPSNPTSARITTTEGSKTELTYEKVSTSNMVYMQAKGTVHINVSNKQLTGSYNDTTVRQLKNDINNTKRKTDVVTTLDVYMNQEESDSRDYNKIRFTMPSGMGLLQLRLHTPWFTVVRDSETTEVNIYEGIVDSNSNIKSWGNGLTHIYKVTTTKAGEVTVVFPWEWPDRADLDSLRVSYISADGKDSRILPYGVVTEGIKFTMPANGYFAIKNLNRDYPYVPFLDVQSHWAYSYICHAYENGIVAGTSYDAFTPDGNVTRAQLVTLLARMRGMEPGKYYGDIPYTDVSEGDWFFSSISFCYAAGVITPDGNEFKPDETVTRAQTIALAEKMFNYKGTLWTPFNCTDRDQVPTYALRPMDALYTCGVVNGTDGNRFNPAGTLTRAEVVAILYRLQVADYWQTKTAVLKNDKLDSKLVKNSPNIWVDDGAKYFTKTTDVQSAMQYFQTTTGVRPYLVTTSTAKSAEDIYKSKFTDNGHMVVVLTKLNDRGGYSLEVYAGSDAKTIISQEVVELLLDRFDEVWASSTMSSAEAVTSWFRNTADDIMSSEVVTNPSDWKAPTVLRDVDKTKGPSVKPGEEVKPEDPIEKPAEPVASTPIIVDMQVTEPLLLTSVPDSYTGWTKVDDNWEQRTGVSRGYNVQILRCKYYSAIHFSSTNTDLSPSRLLGLFGITIPNNTLTLVKQYDTYTLVDKATASSIKVTPEGTFGEIVYGAPQSVVDTMLENLGVK